MRTLLGMSQRTLRRTARLLLVTLSVTTLGPVLHGAHDPDLAPVVIVHDESQHYVQAAAQSHGLDADHCVACHFVRSSRGPVSWEPCGVVALSSGKLLYHSDRE